MKSKLIHTAVLAWAITITASQRSNGTCWVPAADVVCVPKGTLDDWDYTDGIDGWDSCWDNAGNEESWDYDYVYTSAAAKKPAVDSIEHTPGYSSGGHLGTYSSLAYTEVPTELRYPDPDDCTQTDILPDYGLTSISCTGKHEDTFSEHCNHS